MFIIAGIVIFGSFFLCGFVVYWAVNKHKTQEEAKWRGVSICDACDYLHHYRSTYSPCANCGEKKLKDRTARWIDGKREVKN